MRIVVACLLVLLGACSDQPPLADAGPEDGLAADRSTLDAPGPDLGPDGPPPIPCTTHYDCAQGSYCYLYDKKCVTDPGYPVYHCNKKDSSGNDTCPPGRWCIDKQGKKSTCAESATYECQDACDCGPAHCCKSKRCFKDTKDPWIPGGTATTTCTQGTDATYCFTDPTCYEGQKAYAAKPALGPAFRAYSRKLKTAVNLCGGRSCFGTACNCKPGEQCVDTLQDQPSPGKACNVFSGGSCVSSALAEAVFNYKPTDLLPCCSATCPKGKTCDAGWISDGMWVYRRIEGTCGSCGNGVCDPGEWYKTCTTDCLCGNDACDPGEISTCPQDCAKCGNGVCDPGEVPPFSPLGEVCAADCTCGNGSCDPGELASPGLPSYCAKDCSCGDGICSLGEDCAKDCSVCKEDYLSDRGRICGDGFCDRTGCHSLESCRSCPDCPACTWEVGDRSTAGLTSVQIATAAWGDLSAGFLVVADAALYRYNGTSWSAFPSPALPVTYMWGTSVNNLYVTGARTYHYDGAAWSEMTLPSGSVWGSGTVWGRSAKDVYVTTNNSPTSRLLHYDGNSKLQWGVVYTFTGPTLPGAIWGPPGSDDLYVATSSFPNGGMFRCKVTSKSCSQMNLSTGINTVSDIWGAKIGAKLDVFAVGGEIWHHDGNAAGTWTKMTSPVGPAYLRSVWGRSATEVYAVGYKGLILHYDGKAWSQMVSPATSDLVQVWGDASDVFAMVEPTGAILHLDSTKKQWTVLTSPSGEVSHSPTPATGIWGSSATDVFALLGNKVVHHDGKTWKPMAAPGTARLHGIWGRSSSDVIAVGGDVVESGQQPAPRVVRYDGTKWSKAPAPASNGALFDIWGDTSALYAVGMDGELWRHDGKTWQSSASISSAEQLFGVWGCSATKVAAVGRTTSGQGLVVLYDASAKSWTSAQVSGVTHLFDVWCDSTGTIFAAGGQIISTSTGGFVLAQSEPRVVTCTSAAGGLSCAVVTPPLQGQQLMNPKAWSALHGVWGTSAKDVFVVGARGGMLHYDGATWRHLSADIRTTSGRPSIGGGFPGCSDLLGLWGTKNALFTSSANEVLRLDRLP